jgi:hypothetical protein
MTLPTYYHCQHCNKQYTTQKGKEKHENSCVYSPNISQTKAKFTSSLDSLIKTATNPLELFSGISSIYKEHGVEIIFTEVPNTYNSSYKERYSTEIFKAFVGTLRAKIVSDREVTKNLLKTITKQDHSPYVSYLISALNTKGIRLGSGGGGESASFHCAILLDHFPAMAKQFDTPDQELKRLQNNYKIHLKDFFDNYDKAENHYCSTHKETIFLEKIHSKLEKLKQQLNTVMNQNFEVRKTEFKNNFNQQKLPEYKNIPPAIYHLALNMIPTSDPWLEKQIKQLNTSTEDLNKFITEYNTFVNKYPELLI